MLGICGVHMPLIYGEREESAFRRLRKELKGIDATFDAHADAPGNDHMQDDSFHSLRDTTGKDPKDLAGVRTNRLAADKRRLEEATRDWSKDTCEAHGEDSETDRPPKRRHLGSVVGE